MMNSPDGPLKSHIKAITKPFRKPLINALRAGNDERCLDHLGGCPGQGAQVVTWPSWRRPSSPKAFIPWAKNPQLRRWLAPCTVVSAGPGLVVVLVVSSPSAYRNSMKYIHSNQTLWFYTLCLLFVCFSVVWSFFQLAKMRVNSLESPVRGGGQRDGVGSDERKRGHVER